MMPPMTSPVTPLMWSISDGLQDHQLDQIIADLETIKKQQGRLSINDQNILNTAYRRLDTITDPRSNPHDASHG